METEEIDKTCNLCGSEAKGVIKNGDNSIVLCPDCARKVFWELSHNDYAFSEED